MKELEALEKLIVEDGFRVVSKDDERYIIVRKGLERLEKLEKAIEIIKEKKVDIWYEIMMSVSYDNYLDTKTDLSETLTEEEFNLLKEVFGNEN